MRKSKFITAGVIMGLFVSNVAIAQSYIIDKNHQEREIRYKDKVIKYNHDRYQKDLDDMKLVIDGQSNKIDDQSKIIDAKSVEIYQLQQQIEKSMKDSESPMRQFNMQVTAYTSTCEGCSGFTYTGLDVRNTIEYEGRRVIAADFNKIPLYSIVKIETDTDSYEAIVLDTGGAIRNSNVIDLLVSDYDTAIQFGRKQANVTILREGKG